MLETIISSFGIVGALFSIAGSGIIWFLAHSSAQPGTSVSILWGLVTYTKSSSKPSTPANDVDNKTTNFARNSKAKEISSSEFIAGKELRTIEDRENSTAEAEYFIYHPEWAEGIKEKLKNHTSAQKTFALRKLLNGKRTIVRGQVKDVDINAHSTYITLDNGFFLVAKDGEGVAVPDLHIGDMVQAKGQIDPDGSIALLYKMRAFEIERVAKGT